MKHCAWYRMFVLRGAVKKDKEKDKAGKAPSSSPSLKAKPASKTEGSKEHLFSSSPPASSPPPSSPVGNPFRRKNSKANLDITSEGSSPPSSSAISIKKSSSMRFRKEEPPDTESGEHAEDLKVRKLDRKFLLSSKSSRKSVGSANEISRDMERNGGPPSSVASSVAATLLASESKSRRRASTSLTHAETQSAFEEESAALGRRSLKHSVNLDLAQENPESSTSLASTAIASDSTSTAEMTSNHNAMPPFTLPRNNFRRSKSIDQSLSMNVAVRVSRPIDSSKISFQNDDVISERDHIISKISESNKLELKRSLSADDLGSGNDRDAALLEDNATSSRSISISASPPSSGGLAVASSASSKGRKISHLFSPFGKSDGRVHHPTTAHHPLLQWSPPLVSVSITKARGVQADAESLIDAGRQQRAKSLCKEACESFSKAIALLRAEINNDPQNERVRLALACALYFYGDGLLSANSASLACAAARESLEIVCDLLDDIDRQQLSNTKRTGADSDHDLDQVAWVIGAGLSVAKLFLYRSEVEYLFARLASTQKDVNRAISFFLASISSRAQAKLTSPSLLSNFGSALLKDIGARISLMKSITNIEVFSLS